MGSLPFTAGTETVMPGEYYPEVSGGDIGMRSPRHRQSMLQEQANRQSAIAPAPLL
jgi:hypothetical protein